MLDIHAHLQFPDYDADRDAVIARARGAGVEQMILVGTDLESSRAAVELAGKHEFLSASVGIHPHEFNEVEQIPSSTSQTPNKSEIPNTKIQNSGSRVKPGMTERGNHGQDWIAMLRELARHPKVVAIGECGLDYFVRVHQGTMNNEQRTGISEQRTISDAQKAIQREGFLAQMDIAREAGLPMIIHTRPSAGSMDAYADLYGMLSDPDIARSASKFVLHCYQGDTDVTEQFLRLPRVYFSFAGNVTYPVKKVLVGTKNDIVKTVGLVPLDRMFVETDCPYLSPQEKRGTRNEPSYVVLTAARVSALKGVDARVTEQALRSNFSEVFRMALSPHK